MVWVIWSIRLFHSAEQLSNREAAEVSCSLSAALAAYNIA
jgi:hypothetical protein